jgi:Glu-tRNA(Gln) amidotransferase subunit E-like FAD-binding protein
MHSDLEKSLPRTRSEHAYYMTFRNDWSNVIWMHLLRNKNQAFDAFKKFQINIERSVDDCKIVTLRKNNVEKYIDQKFQNYLISQRINWNSRVSYVSEQNDEIERLNRTLMYKIELMLNDRKILKNMWEEIIKIVAYLSNRSSHYQHDKTSYEMIKNKNLIYLICESLNQRREFTFSRKKNQKARRSILKEHTRQLWKRKSISHLRLSHWQNSHSQRCQNWWNVSYSRLIWQRQ